MVTSGSTRIEGGGTQILSAGVRKTIQTIKEIVGNHSDADIYFALKDSNMDPNETAQKLLNQGQCFFCSNWGYFNSFMVFGLLVFGSLVLILSVCFGVFAAWY